MKKRQSISKLPVEISTALRKTKASIEIDVDGCDSRAGLKKHARAISIDVYKHSMARAFRFLRHLLVKIHEVGGVLKLSGSKYIIEYRGRRVKFGLKEPLRDDWHHAFRIGLCTGSKRLELTIEPPIGRRCYERWHTKPIVWTDDEEGKLETKIDAIAASIPAMYAAEIAAEEKEEEARRVQAEKDKLWAIEKAKEESAQKNLKAILSASRQWRQAREISDFLAEAERILPRPYNHDTETWFNICRDVISAADPFRGGFKPWENLIRAEHEGQLTAFINLKIPDPLKELAKLLEDQRDMSYSSYSEPCYRYYRR